MAEALNQYLAFRSTVITNEPLQPCIEINPKHTYKFCMKHFHALSFKIMMRFSRVAIL
jgi:hypothetical protein